MRVAYKPLKIILFGLAMFGILSLDIQGKKIITHLSDWITSRKLQTSSERWAKDKATDLLGKAKNKISDTLTEEPTEPEEVQPVAQSQPPQKPIPGELIPGTAIPKSVATTPRQAKIIQKLNLENEQISGDDKKELSGILGQ